MLRFEPAGPDSWRPHRRRRIVSWCLAAAFLAIGLRLITLQTLAAERLSRKALRQQITQQPLPARPGDIYDRNGRLLATTISVPSLFIDPSQVSDPEQLAAQLADVRPLDPQAFAQRIRDSWQRRFLWVHRRLNNEEADRARALQLPRHIAGFQSELQRRYPQGAVAAHVLGWRNIDGAGQGGVEQYCDSKLRGVDGIRRYVRDARGYAIDILEEVTAPPQHGADLTLTIDVVLQLFLEQQLDAVMRHCEPIGACAIALDPRSGEVLAMGSRPAFDPNSPADAPPSAWKNLAIAAAYEPGSTFKPVIVAAGLQQAVIARDEQFYCGWGAYRMGRRVLHDHHPYGSLSLTDVLVKSSNIGMAQIGERLGNEQLHHWSVAFGFGQRTGIEAPGELTGSLRPLNQWNLYSTGSIPMGQELTATPIQMIAAHAALANHGERISPHLVMQGDAKTSAPRSMLKSQIVDATLADWLVQGPLVEVVERGTAKAARSPGLRVFGKTGTAQKASARGYSATRNVASFVCGGPADDPRLLVLVCVDEPRGADQFGGTVAAEPAARILRFGLSLPSLNVAADAPATIESAR